MKNEIKTKSDVAVIQMLSGGSLAWKAGDVLVISEDAAHTLPDAVWQVLQRLAEPEAKKATPLKLEPPRATPEATPDTYAPSPWRGRSSLWSIDGCNPVQWGHTDILIKLHDLTKSARGETVEQHKLLDLVHPKDARSYWARRRAMVLAGYIEAQEVVREPSKLRTTLLSLTPLGKALVEKFGDEMRAWCVVHRAPVVAGEASNSPRELNGIDNGKPVSCT